MRESETAALTIRLPASMRDEFARAMREAGTTASAHLRKAIEEAVTGRIPGPIKLSPAEHARAMVAKDGKVGDGDLVGDNQGAAFPLAPTERRYRDTIIFLSQAVLAQDAALRRVAAAVNDFQETGYAP
ncbi:MAG: hypothetical protein HY985_06050 [Magnetospirillum sp.]|nr:hypothetical protein [Magnetospirillum sp.]